jgi:predicted Zn finger-like uncharacterized protein
MYVACPSCKALYKIELAHLRAAGGQLHCGACKARFNASAAVFEDPQQALAYDYPLQEEEAQAIDDLVHRALDEVSGQADKIREEAAGDEDQDIIDSALASKPVAAHRDSRPLRADVDFHAWPVAAEFPVQSQQALLADDDELQQAYLLEHVVVDGGSTSWGVIAAALSLTFLIMAQYVWADRYHLAQIASWRPALEIFCKPLNCDLPLRRDLGQVEIVEREIVRHPHIADALLVNATFINNAAFTQAYPQFQVSFSDVSGAPVAARRFQPGEYLAVSRDTNAGMAPGEQIHALLEVIDPGERAVSFQFDFF